MATFKIRHETVYRYSSPVAFGEHRMMLRPREGRDQHVLDYHLEIAPEPKLLTWSEDASGNAVAIARFGRRARDLRVVVTMSVEHATFRADDLAIAAYARTCPFAYGAEEMPDLLRFAERQHPDAEHSVDAWARRILAEDPERDTWRFLTRLTATVRRDFAYLRRDDPGMQSPSLTLRTRSGSCRDFALLMSEAVRTQGLAARFVSGYLHVHPTGDERARRAGGSTHAWLQVYLPGAGWIDFDPTSGAVGNRDLVRVAVVRDPAQASPLAGTFLGFPSDFEMMSVDVQVELDANIERARSAAATSAAA